MTFGAAVERHSVGMDTVIEAGCCNLGYTRAVGAEMEDFVLFHAEAGCVIEDILGAGDDRFRCCRLSQVIPAVKK